MSPPQKPSSGRDDERRRPRREVADPRASPSARPKPLPGDYSALFDVFREALLVVRVSDGRILRANPLAAALLGRSAADLQKSALYDLMPEAVRPRVRAFIKRYGIRFPILVAGTTDQAVATLPQLVNFGVYPTTLILGRDGRVRQVHAGFSSAATGEAHLQLKRETRELIARLLAEKPPVKESEGGSRP